MAHWALSYTQRGIALKYIPLARNKSAHLHLDKQKFSEGNSPPFSPSQRFSSQKWHIKYCWRVCLLPKNCQTMLDVFILKTVVQLPTGHYLSAAGINAVTSTSIGS